MTRRTDRVGVLLQEEISRLVRSGINDPRLGGMVSVTYVDVSTDLGHAIVAISVMGTAEDQQKAVRGMESSAGWLRRELASRLRLRQVPHLRFLLDPTLQEAEKLLAVMDRVKSQEQGEHA